jgi:hypothetical protein
VPDVQASRRTRAGERRCKAVRPLLKRVPDVERFAPKNFLSDLKREITDSLRDLGRRVIASSILIGTEATKKRAGKRGSSPVRLDQ